MNIDELLELSEKFEKRAQNAPTVSVQPEAVQTALEQAGLWNKTNEVAPLLNAAKVSPEATVAIGFTVSKGPQVNFNITLVPPNPPVAVRLANLLKAKYSAAMVGAIKAAKLNIMDPLFLKWMSF